MDQTSATEKAHQRKKFEEIVEVLITAGYNRANVSNLSDFDKVVGGLCWSIMSTGEDVDVDILFQENSTIGQRIALTEAIVVALRKMGCPSPLQAHQIQGGVGGSDYAAIHPVVHWLIKKVHERRVERSTQIRAFSTLQFSKNYCLPEENRTLRGPPKHLKAIVEGQKAVRIYRRKVSRNESEEKRVLSCLLEFGETFTTGAKGSDGTGGGAGAGTVDNSKILLNFSEGDVALEGMLKFGMAGDMGGFERKLAQAAKDALKEEQLMAERAAQHQAEIMGQMKQVTPQGEGGEAEVGAFVNISADEITSASAAYEAELESAKRLMELTMAGAGGKLGQAAAYKRQKEALLAQRDEIDAKITELRVLSSSVLSQLEVAEEERNSTADYNEQLKQQIHKLDELERSIGQREDFVMLRHLVSLEESLKKQETAFKESCAAQLVELQAQLQAIEKSEEESSEEVAKLKEIEEAHAAATAKYARLREALAEHNRSIASSVRVIDDVPSRIELIQYERRFAELYQQVAWKLEETRKYYGIYNTLDTTLSFLQKEVKLLDSISETFPTAMKSSSTRREFLEQFENIVQGVEESLVRQRSILDQRDQQVENMKATHQKLVEDQRRYFKAVKDFQDECTKNEWLLAKLEELKTAH